MHSRRRRLTMNELLVFLGILVVLQPPAPAQGKGGFYCSAGTVQHPNPAKGKGFFYCSAGTVKHPAPAQGRGGVLLKCKYSPAPHPRRGEVKRGKRGLL